MASINTAMMTPSRQRRIFRSWMKDSSSGKFSIKFIELDSANLVHADHCCTLSPLWNNSDRVARPGSVRAWHSPQMWLSFPSAATAKPSSRSSPVGVASSAPARKLPAGRRPAAHNSTDIIENQVNPYAIYIYSIRPLCPDLFTDHSSPCPSSKFASHYSRLRELFTFFIKFT